MKRLIRGKNGLRQDCRKWRVKIKHLIWVVFREWTKVKILEGLEGEETLGSSITDPTLHSEVCLKKQSSQQPKSVVRSSQYP